MNSSVHTIVLSGFKDCVKKWLMLYRSEAYCRIGFTIYALLCCILQWCGDWVVRGRYCVAVQWVLSFE